jgi:hypothetical protein
MMMAEASSLEKAINFPDFFLEHRRDTFDGALEKIKFKKLAYFSSPKK